MTNYNAEIHPIVLIKSEGVYGVVIDWAADLALVQYSYEGITFQEYLEEDEYEVIAGIMFNGIEDD